MNRFEEPNLLVIVNSFWINLSLVTPRPGSIDQGAVGIGKTDEAFLAAVTDLDHFGLGPELDALGLEIFVVLLKSARAQGNPANPGVPGVG